MVVGCRREATPPVPVADAAQEASPEVARDGATLDASTGGRGDAGTRRDHDASAEAGAEPNIGDVLSVEPGNGDPPSASCAKLDRDQRELLARARKVASAALPGVRQMEPQWGPGGGLYAFVKPVPQDKAHPIAHLAKMHASAMGLAGKEHDEEGLWVLSRSVPSDEAWITLSKSLYPVGFCAAAGHGAWGLEARDVDARGLTVDGESRGRPPPSAAWSASILLTHFDPSGARIAMYAGDCCGDHFDGEIARQVPRLFDYDGDGEAEVILHARDLAEGPDDDEPAVVFTFHAGKVTPYGDLAHRGIFGSPIDADHDGRPDFLTHAGIDLAASKETCGNRACAPRYAPSFLVHSLPDGTFSTVDEVARHFAREACPESPPTIESREDAGCARLWANTDAKVASERDRVRQSCRAFPPAGCDVDASTPPRPGCDCGSRLEAFEQAPPFTLP
jgi:hypothetical protein